MIRPVALFLPALLLSACQGVQPLTRFPVMLTDGVAARVDEVRPLSRGRAYLVFEQQAVYRLDPRCIPARLFGNDADARRFGEGGDQRRFGEGGDQRRFGNDADARRFGEGGDQRRFGDDADARRFGEGGDQRRFGDDADARRFGEGGDQRRFGNDADARRFGDAADQRRFGDDADSRRFGSGAGQMTCAYLQMTGEVLLEGLTSDEAVLLIDGRPYQLVGGRVRL